MRRIHVALFVLAALPLAAQTEKAAIPSHIRAAFDSFRPGAIRAHLKFLSSDLLEGRGPGTRGDALATSYIASQFEAMGLEPAGDDGTYFQKVPLLGITMNSDASHLAFTRNGATTIGPMKYREEFAGGNQSQQDNVDVDSDVIFVGHGVVAPEYKWDDYKGVDVRGKTLIMLVDDPPANTKEPDLFKGRARTYYGRWTYKFETGTAKGAEAVILIHTDPAAGYGWQVVRNSWAGEQAYVKKKEGENALRFAGWITESTAQKLFQSAGVDLAALTKAAASRDFKPVPLKTRFTGHVASTIRPFETSNVIARLEGSDPALKDQAVLYTAHHDHLGIAAPDPADPTDSIYNGAIDNASGAAIILETARVWSQAKSPKRSIYFALVAAEEQGLLGSQFLGEHPPVPAGRIALGLNLDAVYLFGPVTNVTMIGADRMTLFPEVQRVTSAMNLAIVPDQAPEQGTYYRSDHFSMAKAGVPAFSIKQGYEVVGKPAEWGAEKAHEYREKHYHQASDEYDPTWDFNAAVQVGQLAFWLGEEAANNKEMAMWLPGEEFYAKAAAARK